MVGRVQVFGSQVSVAEKNEKRRKEEHAGGHSPHCHFCVFFRFFRLYYPCFFPSSRQGDKILRLCGREVIRG